MKKSILLSATVLAMTLTLTTSCKKHEDCQVFIDNEQEYFKSQGVGKYDDLNQEQKDHFDQNLRQKTIDCYKRNGEEIFKY
jgi:uncharacterized protein YxeA